MAPTSTNTPARGGGFFHGAEPRGASNARVIGAARTAAYAPEQLMQREVLLEQVTCVSCVSHLRSAGTVAQRRRRGAVYALRHTLLALCEVAGTAVASLEARLF